MLDKFGLIDPSSSTVFIGMFLGGTWGFVLDQIFGSDEGYREYFSTVSVTARPFSDLPIQGRRVGLVGTSGRRRTG